MQRIYILALLLIPLGLFAQSERKWVREGNDLFAEGNFSDAVEMYDRSLEEKPGFLPGTFNKGNSLYQLEDYESAIDQFQLSALSSEDEQIKAQAYHNLGNTYSGLERWQEAVDAYKNALRINPNDDDTRYNLAYAQEKLKQQQQNQDQNQDSQDDQDQQEQDKENQDKQDQDQQNQDSQDEQNSEENQDKQNQNSNEQKDQQEQQDKQSAQNEEQQDGEEQQGQPQPREGQMTQEEALRMLEALKNEESKVQAKLQKQKQNGVKIEIEKDW